VQHFDQLQNQRFSMNFVDATLMLAVLQYIAFGTLVAKARGTYGVKAPAITGNEHFERRYRAHANTLELLVVLVPSSYASAHYWPGWAVAIAVLIYLAGRLIYWRTYIAEPSTRTFGFTLSIAPIVLLALSALAAALIGKSAV
jgi:glutathione S-transferase